MKQLKLSEEPQLRGGIVYEKRGIIKSAHQFRAPLFRFHKRKVSISGGSYNSGSTVQKYHHSSLRVYYCHVLGLGKDANIQRQVH